MDSTPAACASVSSSCVPSAGTDQYHTIEAVVGLLVFVDVFVFEPRCFPVFALFHPSMSEMKEVQKTQSNRA